MAIAQAELEAILAAAFPGAEIQVTDLAGDNNHYRASIASPEFGGQTRIQQHKLVWARIHAATDADIHALSLETRPL